MQCNVMYVCMYVCMYVSLTILRLRQSHSITYRHPRLKNDMLDAFLPSLFLKLLYQRFFSIQLRYTKHMSRPVQHPLPFADGAAQHCRIAPATLQLDRLSAHDSCHHNRLDVTKPDRSPRPRLTHAMGGETIN